MQPAVRKKVLWVRCEGEVEERMVKRMRKRVNYTDQIVKPFRLIESEYPHHWRVVRLLVFFQLVRRGLRRASQRQPMRVHRQSGELPLQRWLRLLRYGCGHCLCRRGRRLRWKFNRHESTLREGKLPNYFYFNKLQNALVLFLFDKQRQRDYTNLFHFESSFCFVFKILKNL